MDKFEPINFVEKFKKFNEHWAPKIIADLNDNQFKLVKLKGEFVWHKHNDCDEAFIVIKGELIILFRDGQVKLAAGEMFVVPKGVEHKPVAYKECHLMLVEPKGVINTGDAESKLTAQNDIWI